MLKTEKLKAEMVIGDRLSVIGEEGRWVICDWEDE